jgi:hypothetical protein
MADPPYVVTRVEDVEAVPWPGGLTWHPVRAALGMLAFGVGGYTGGAGDVVIEPHSEARDGRGHQELYVVLTGRARFALDAETFDAPAGTLVAVPDPHVHREAVATEDGTTVLAIGGPPTFLPAGSEWLMRAKPLLPADTARAREILQDGRSRLPESPAIAYGFALLLAAEGNAEAARNELAVAVTAEPRLEHEARSEPLLAPLVDE